MKSSNAGSRVRDAQSSLDSVLKFLVHTYRRAGARKNHVDRAQVRDLLRHYFAQRHQGL